VKRNTQYSRLSGILLATYCGNPPRYDFRFTGFQRTSILSSRSRGQLHSSLGKSFMIFLPSPPNWLGGPVKPLLNRHCSCEFFSDQVNMGPPPGNYSNSILMELARPVVSNLPFPLGGFFGPTNKAILGPFFFPLIFFSTGLRKRPLPGSWLPFGSPLSWVLPSSIATPIFPSFFENTNKKTLWSPPFFVHLGIPLSFGV